MVNEKVQIICNKNLTVTDLHPQENFEKSTIKCGFDGKNIYRSYMYFDISNVVEDSSVKSIILKLYLKKIVTSHMSSTLYIQTLEEEFGKNTTFENQPQYGNSKIKTRIDRDSEGWINLNVRSLFQGSNKNLKNNYGIILSTDENKESLLSFSSNLDNNYLFFPKLIVSFSNVNSRRNEGYIEVIEKNWIFKFKKCIKSEAINVQRIIEGSFFVDNVGNEHVLATVEVSADSVHWVVDVEKYIDVCSTEILVAKYYGKYYRITLNCCDIGKVNIKFVCQVYK
jgi:hypothetical protein